MIHLTPQTLAVSMVVVGWRKPDGSTEGMHTQGTGFHVEWKNRHFLISNRHVLCQPPRVIWTNGATPIIAWPVLFVTYPSASGYREIAYPLFEGTPPVPKVVAHTNPFYDLARIEINLPQDSIAQTVDLSDALTNAPAYQYLGMPHVGQDAFVIGYPTGFNTLGAPVRKSGSLASETEINPTYQMPEGGGVLTNAPVYVLDGTFRPGMSGSPVFVQAEFPNSVPTAKELVRLKPDNPPLFIGVYSSFDPGRELHFVWKASAVAELLEQ
ncbi:MAG TPA: serine protease [Verrucomicrobiota bacterium]|nr:serine protease [Verrucomicrobiota bacterium]